MHNLASRSVGFRTRLAGVVRRFRADVRGVTAVEFGLVAAPFFLVVMGLVTVGTQYMSMHFLEHGVEVASRKLRTGEAQKAGLTVSDFRGLFCDAAGFIIPCDEHLVIHIKSSDTFAGLSPITSCVTDGSLTPAEGNGGDAVRSHAGDASAAVMVSACYQWDMGLGLWQTIWNIILPVPTVEGSPVLSAVTAFRSEPFED
ncbi:pilus assembly protein [Hyphomicrobium sp.]|uniref:TadE/TadG family type IV pilus assembly protein n=1 Tax=Hyphomicrobium sp. TaxID=82 RepID=UPI0025B9D00C|nr:pilus assembly protein [Hyphomicrobium sp.]MCC7251308.1 pilus assembly protein [Hyphomicrobium sp.]